MISVFLARLLTAIREPLAELKAEKSSLLLVNTEAKMLYCAAPLPCQVSNPPSIRQLSKVNCVEASVIGVLEISPKKSQRTKLSGAVLANGCPLIPLNTVSMKVISEVTLTRTTGALSSSRENWHC